MPGAPGGRTGWPCSRSMPGSGRSSAQAREPLLGQVRLAWWRDRLGQDPADWPAGEPLLAALRGWQPQFAALAALVDGWELLLGAPPLPSDCLRPAGRCPGRSLCRARSPAGAGGLGNRGAEGGARVGAGRPPQPGFGCRGAGIPDLADAAGGPATPAARDAPARGAGRAGAAWPVGAARPAGRNACRLVWRLTYGRLGPPTESVPMNRTILGAVAALLLVAGGLFWWQGRAATEQGAPPPDSSAPDDAGGRRAGAARRGRRGPVRRGAARGRRGHPRAAALLPLDRDRDNRISRNEMLVRGRPRSASSTRDGNNLLSFEEWAVATVEPLRRRRRQRRRRADAGRSSRPPRRKPSGRRPRCRC